VRLGKTTALGGKDGSHFGPRHGVSHAHDVDSRNTFANVWMHAFEVMENLILPVAPVPI
jgi:hypothetical protein